jgi:DNA-binding MarR family transcriptional regulator
VYVKILHVKVNIVIDDVMDDFVNEWAAEWPGLDASHLETIGRIWRISEHLRREFDKGLKPLGLTWESFDLLASLRRSGKPYRMRPSELNAACLLTSGAMTNRLNQVERLGLIERLSDPTDRRAIQVALTPEGLALAEKAIDVQFSAARELLRSLPPSEKDTLAPILRRILATFEPARDASAS